MRVANCREFVALVVPLSSLFHIYIYIRVPSVRIPVILGKTTKRDVNCYRERGTESNLRRGGGRRWNEDFLVFVLIRFESNLR